MRYIEIIREVVGHNPAIRARIASFDRECVRAAELRPAMYGHGALDGEIEAEQLEAARLENERLRLEIALMKAALASNVDVSKADLIRSQALKARADAVAALGDL